MPWRQRRPFNNALASALSAQALGATRLIRGLGSPSECRVGGRPSTSRDSWVGHRRDASGERARGPPHLRSSKRKPMLGSFSGILLRVVILTCILPPDPPPPPPRQTLPLGRPPGCEPCALSPLLPVLAIPRIVQLLSGGEAWEGAVNSSPKHRGAAYTIRVARYITKMPVLHLHLS